jgi:hypothetical protein
MPFFSNQLYYPSLFFALLAFSACGTEVKKERKDQIIGRWVLTQAFRDGQATVTLNGTWFAFQSDGVLQTNMPETDTISNYSLLGDQIKQVGSTGVDYRILDLTDSTLAVTTELQGFMFELRFRRVH